MNINLPTKIYGLIGYPLGHSFSPAMHNAAFKELDINGEYKLFEVSPDKFDHFLQSLDKENIYGLNVTVPYKERILKFVELDQESNHLKQIGAVNTIVRQDNMWKGFNTDVSGFGRHLEEVFDPKDKRVALLGAGGAARAAVYVLIKKGAKEIVIFDIDKIKSENVTSMAKDISPDFKISAVDSISDLCIKDKDLLINATPVGLRQDDPCLIDESTLHKNLFIYDLIYNPAETKLLLLAKRLGIKYSNGLNMLIYQGALSFAHFTGKDSSLDEIIRIMKRAANERMKKIC